MSLIQELVNLAIDLQGVNTSLLDRSLGYLKTLPINHQYSQAANLCRDNTIIHPDWGMFSGKIKMHEIKSTLPATFSESTSKLKVTLNEKYATFIAENAEELDKIVCKDRDWRYNVFAVETLLKSYLARVKQDDLVSILETPQYLFLRVATFLWFPNIERIKRTYNDLSLGHYVHASPTLFNCGMRRHQLSSCFLMTVQDDLKSIKKSWGDCAEISMGMGAIGINHGCLRHSQVGHFGDTNGIIPWTKILNEILKAVNQGTRRPGSGAVYLPPWHIDIEEFLDLKKATGAEDMRARDLFYALWLSDEFMRRVENDEMWTLMCPNKAKGLNEKWGKEFEMAYKTYEEKFREGKLLNCRRVRARDLMNKICNTQIEIGMPYILFKDAINRKSNQKNLGTTCCSNLCCEITEYTDDKNIASCNLSNVALNSCVTENRVYDFDMLERLTRDLVQNLNQTIDRNYYPDDVPEIKETNLRNRPLGIGVQGLADTFALMDLAWEDPEARKLNHDIFETMYYAAVTESVELAKRDGPYETFPGSPASKGLLQFDLWSQEKAEKQFDDQSKNNPNISIDFFRNIEQFQSERYNWRELREQVKRYGMRNSLLLALMPTASSAHILGNTESFEPFSSLIYARTVNAGQFVINNKYMVKDLEDINMWKTEVVRQIVSDKGSIQNVSDELCPEQHVERFHFLKKKYKTVFEISQKYLLDLSIDRGKFICQTQSFNCNMKDATCKKLTAYHFHAWKSGAKTGMYYLRQIAKTDPMNFSLNTINVPSKKKEVVCNEEVCLVCQ